MRGLVVLLGALGLGMSVAQPAGQSAPPPAVTVGVPNAGNAFPALASSGRLAAVAWSATVGGQGTDVMLAVSNDGGATFGRPVRVNAIRGEAQINSERPPRVAIVPRAGGTDIVVLWTARQGETTTLKVARSADGGRTFAAPSLVHSAGAAGNRGWASMAVDAAGTPHVIWLDHRNAIPAQGGSRTGDTAEHQHHNTSTAAASDGVAMAQRSALYYAAPGATGERDLTRGVCYCCKTAIATGSGGLVAAAWRHVYTGNIRDIAFTLSKDGGRTFSTPSRVSQDGWAINGCPEDGPSMAADETGLLHIVWPTVLPGANPRGALFYASTRDGRTFSPRRRITTFGGAKPEHPQLTVDTGNRVFVAFDELAGGRRSVGLVTITASGKDAPVVGAPQRIATGEVRYPALTRTNAGALVAWTSGPPPASSIRVTQVTSWGPTSVGLGGR